MSSVRNFQVGALVFTRNGNTIHEMIPRFNFISLFFFQFHHVLDLEGFKEMNFGDASCWNIAKNRQNFTCTPNFIVFFCTLENGLAFQNSSRFNYLVFCWILCNVTSRPSIIISDSYCLAASTALSISCWGRSLDEFELLASVKAGERASEMVLHLNRLLDFGVGLLPGVDGRLCQKYS